MGRECRVRFASSDRPFACAQLALMGFTDGHTKTITLIPMPFSSRTSRCRVGPQGGIEPPFSISVQWKKSETMTEIGSPRRCVRAPPHKLFLVTEPMPALPEPRGPFRKQRVPGRLRIALHDFGNCVAGRHPVIELGAARSPSASPFFPSSTRPTAGLCQSKPYMRLESRKGRPPPRSAGAVRRPPF